MKRKGWFLVGAIVACCGIMALLLSARTPANPPLNPSLTLDKTVDVPPEIASILRRSCYDCHSHTTRWPWYSKLPVASHIVANDVARARKAMNFSQWPSRDGRPTNIAGALLLAACSAMQESIMPPERYLVLHPGARISKEEAQRFCAWSSRQAVGIAAANRTQSVTPVNE